MLIAVVVFQALLWVWFFGCITTYKFGKIFLVGGEGVKSIEFAMMCMYSAGVALFHIYLPVGRWFLLAILLLWIAVQFRSHWYYTIFGASARKLTGYNEWFKGTARIFPVSETRLIPDLYHIVLHLLIVANIVCAILR